MFKTRIDDLRIAQEKVEIFSDFKNSFECHPVTGNLIRVVNDDAIKQGISNKIKTIFGERYLLPNEGSKVMNSLFEPNDNFLKEDIEKSIKNAFQNDGKVTIQKVDVEIDDVTINILLNVFIIGNNLYTEIPVTLRRVV